MLKWERKWARECLMYRTCACRERRRCGNSPGGDYGRNALLSENFRLVPVMLRPRAYDAPATRPLVGGVHGRYHSCNLPCRVRGRGTTRLETPVFATLNGRHVQHSGCR